MIRIIFTAIIISGFLSVRLTKAQTNPAPQSLPYSQVFSSFTGSSTTYPAGWQGWTISGSLGTSFSTAAPNGDQALAGATNATTTPHVGDFNGKLGLMSSGSAIKAVVLSINTTGCTSISVSFDAMTQRTENTRQNEMGVQYRIGNSGTFTDIAGSTYQNQMTPTNTTGTTSVKIENVSFTLPAACNNQSVVQLRWIIRDVSGSGNRPGFGIDNVSVTGSCGGASITTGSITGTPFTLANCSSTGSGSVAYTISGTFNAGNVFTAELSDASGSFAQPLAIGSVTSTSAGSISITIPAGIPTGSGYRIRVTSSDPVVTGSNSSAFTITQNGSYCPWLNDYRSNATTYTWATAPSWQQYTYNSGTKSLNWTTAGSKPDAASINVFIRNGHTVTLTESKMNVKHLIVENGGKLYRNASGVSQLCYVNIHGDIVCNGTIGNGTTNDAIGFNIQAGSHTISGSGNFDCYRIRNSDETGGGNSTLTIDMNLNLRWTQTIGGAGSGTNALYNERSASCTFDVTINAGKTVNITNTTGDGGFGWDGPGIGSYPGQNRGGTYTIYGTLLANGPIWLGSDNTTNKPQLVIKNGGLVRALYVDFSSDNVTSGAGLTIESGGKLELNGASSGSTWLNTSAGSVTFSIQPNSTVEYSGTNQTIYNGFNYKKLIINGGGIKTLTGNVQVDEELTLTNGIVSTGSNRIYLANSSTSSLVGGSSSSFINGNFRRNIASNTSTYNFPIGDGTSTTNYKRMEFLNNNINGVSYLDVFVNSITEGGNDIQSRLDTTGKCREDGDGGPLLTPLSQLLNTGQWDLTPNTAPSGGNYGVRLYFANVSGLSSSDDNRFAVVKRPSTSTDYFDWDAFASTTTMPPINAAGRTFASGYAEKNGFTSFSKFAIAKAKVFNTPLPVELLSFDVTKEKNNVLIKWSTLSEKNNDYFVVERSTNGVYFTPLAKVKGQGNSFVYTQYTAYDENPLNGTNYYRLKQVDYDGHFSYSDIKSVNFTKGQISPVTIVKNENGGIKVISNFNDRINYVCLIDVSGRTIDIVHEFLENNTIEIATTTLLPKGLYFLSFMYDNGNKQTVKWVVE
jgi:hypothetical protein